MVASVPTLMSSRARTIVGVGILIIAVGVVLFFALPTRRAAGQVVIVAGALMTACGLVHDRLYSNRLSLVFTEDPPYIVSDTKDGYRAEFRLGVRGSRRVPHDVKVLVMNVQPTPSSYPTFRADYPYRLPQRGQHGDREVLFQLGAAGKNTEGAAIFSGIQLDNRDEPDTFAMGRHEIWDVALKVMAADARSLDAWISIAPDADGKVRVSRHNWKPITL